MENLIFYWFYNSFARISSGSGIILWQFNILSSHKDFCSLRFIAAEVFFLFPSASGLNHYHGAPQSPKMACNFSLAAELFGLGPIFALKCIYISCIVSMYFLWVSLNLFPQQIAFMEIGSGGENKLPGPWPSLSP